MSLTVLPSAFTVRFDDLQRLEQENAEAVADQAAIWQERKRVAEMSHRERHECIYRATAYLRSHHAAWRVRAMEQAVQAVHDTILAGDVGALFCEMPPEKRHAIARTLAFAAVGSHQGCLEGTSAMTAADYLRVTAEAREEDS